MMGGSVMRTNRTKHWSKSPQSPRSQAVDAGHHAAGFSTQISEGGGTSTLDCALQQKVRGG